MRPLNHPRESPTTGLFAGIVTGDPLKTTVKGIVEAIGFWMPLMTVQLRRSVDSAKPRKWNASESPSRQFPPEKISPHVPFPNRINVPRGPTYRMSVGPTPVMSFKPLIGPRSVKLI